MNYKKILKKVLIALAVFIVLGGTLTFWLYAKPVTDFKIKVFKKLPLPVASVNGHFLSMQDYLDRYNAAKKVLGANLTENEIKKAAYNQLIIDTGVAILAQNKGINVSKNQVDDEYESRVKTSDLEGKKNFEDLIQSYGFNKDDYKSEVIKPWLLTNSLRTWFSGQRDLNTKTYTLADELVAKITKVEDMGGLSRTYSADETEKASQGDLGFLEITELLPEIRETVSSMQLGDVKIIPSRVGVHIIRLEAKIENQLHLREIFLNTENYSAWQIAELNKFKIKKLLTF